MTQGNTQQTLCFKPDWKVSALAVLLLPGLLSLGFWQLSRAEEKRVIKAIFEQQKNRPPVLIQELSHDQDLRYRQVSLRGEFLNEKVILLDNRINRGRFGYEVVSPFKLSAGSLVVLINRGWIAADKSRRSLPVIDTITGEVQFTGEIYVPQGKMLSLGNEQDDSWPRVIQSLNIAELAADIDGVLFPYSVRMRANATGAYLPNWMTVNIQPDKHIAYAVQWFAMAGTLVIILLLANTNLWQLVTQRKKS